jgi:hypothetical protein
MRNEVLIKHSKASQIVKEHLIFSDKVVGVCYVSVPHLYLHTCKILYFYSQNIFAVVFIRIEGQSNREFPSPVEGALLPASPMGISL